MFRCRSFALACLAILLACVAAAEVRAAVLDSAEIRDAAGRTFACTAQPSETQPAYRVWRLTFPSPIRTSHEPNNTVPADLFLPSEAKHGDRRPAVLCLHILHGNFELERVTCAALAARGIPALLIKLPYYGERELPGGTRAIRGNPQLFVSALPQALADIRRAVDVLAARPEVDPAKLGVVGISMGGIIGASAAGHDPRLGRAALVLAGGDLPGIIHHARETRELSRWIMSLPADERSKVDEGLRQIDPLTTAAALRPRARAGRVLMINASEDEVVPRRATEQLAQALGIGDKVVWLEGLAHYTAIAALPKVLDQACDFFAADLPPALRKTPPAPPPTPAGIDQLAKLLGQVAAIVGREPRSGRAHIAAAEIKAEAGGKPLAGQLRLIRGGKQRFVLEVKTGEFDVAVGQAEYPWLSPSTKIVFRGTAGTADDGPLAYAAPRHLERLKAAAALVGGAAAAPAILEQLLTVKPARDADGPLLTVVPRQRKGLEVVVRFQPSAEPKLVTAVWPGGKAEIRIRSWQVDAPVPDGLFREPGGRPVQDVDARQLTKMFSAVFNLLAEKLQ